MITINNVKLRLRNVRATEMMAFLTVYGKAVNDNDFDALDSSYEQLLTWIEAEVNGSWIKMYDKQSGECIVLALKEEFNDPMFVMKLMPLIEPFIARSNE